jgi:predicted Rossmann-fold nucleotide-binding protein
VGAAGCWHNHATMSRPLVEIDTLAAFDAHLDRTAAMGGWFVQSLDLRGRSVALAEHDPRAAVFLGCRFAPGVEDQLRRRGALVFPRLPDLPFDPYRGSLYDAAELYGRSQPAQTRYSDSPDAAIYAWSQTSGPPSLGHALATALHDHAITDALDDATAGLDPQHLVGVMGGHALQRGEPAYAAAADLGGRLARAGRTVLTGGGPGAMEAANLGAYLSTDGASLPAALALLAAAPGYRTGIEAWIGAAFAVRELWPPEQAGRSLSIPTWFYGHEPTNVFATGIAKYFANAVREDTLLHRCRGGIVYLPGQAGTVQEIFQAATENFYAPDPSRVAPMVLVGMEYWTTTYPAWPLLQRLAADRPMSLAVSCVDSVGEAAELLL